MNGLIQHLQSGVTTVARCWAVVRRDGTAYGFTDHDLPLEFDGMIFKADSGMTARSVVTGTGLAVDNGEAMGALSDSSISEVDIEAGRFDGAEVTAWLVNWTDVADRQILFAGSIGELRRSGGAFHAELRGLTEALNRPQGRVYQSSCPAILGDTACGVDLTDEALSVEIALDVIEEQRRFRFEGFDQFEPAWFERGRLTVLSGEAQGLVSVVKRDRIANAAREIEIWEALRAPVRAGDLIRLEAGCDKRFETCRTKFDNVLNFRGFPHIPGDDWLMRPPRAAERAGGSASGGASGS